MKTQTAENTASMSVDPDILAHMQFAMLSPENKEKVIRFAERLKATEYTP